MDVPRTAGPNGGVLRLLYRFTVLAATVLLSVTGFAPGHASANTPDPNDLCTLLPSGLPPAPGSSATSVPGQPGNTCTERIYTTDPAPAGGYSTGGTISVTLFSSPDQARGFATAPSSNSSDPARPETTYGDAGEEFGGGSTGAVPALLFSRGCYGVSTNAGEIVNADTTSQALPPDTMDQVAGQTDAILSTLPACPAAVGGSATTPALSAGLSCDTGSLQDSGRVLCTASVTDQAANAQLVYDWTFDGQAQSGVTGNRLSLTNVTPGSHQVTVVARDTQNSVSAPPQSASFTRSSGTAGSAPGAPSLGNGGGPGTSSTSGGGSNLGPLVAAAAALAALLGTLAFLRHRRRNRPATAGPQPGPQPGPESGPQWGPVALRSEAPAPVLLSPLPHEKRRRKRRSRPRVDLTVRVSPSVRTRGMYPDDDPHIWGDGVDLVFAEYDLGVSPSEWVLDHVVQHPGARHGHPFKARAAKAHPTTSRLQEFGEPHERDHGSREPVVIAESYTPSMRYSFATGRTDFLHPPPGGRIPPAPPPHTQVVITARWSKQNRSLAVWAELDVVVRNLTTGRTRKVRKVKSPHVPVQVIGARPRLELRADPPGPGCADGSSRIRVEPALFLFGRDPGGRGNLYPGGLEIVEIPRSAHNPGHGSLELHDYFEVTEDPRGVDHMGRPVARHPDAAMRRQGLSLRCRFHLRDSAIRKLRTAPEGGYPVTFNVRPTGYGLAEPGLGDGFEWMAARHYHACREHLHKVPTHRIQPATIRLEPSDVRLHADATGLPRPDRPPDAMFRVQLSGTVLSAAHWPVPGSAICRDRPSGRSGRPRVADWWLRFEWTRPESPLLRQWDPGPPQLGPLPVDDVDERGRLSFAVPPADRTSEEDAGAARPQYEHDHWSFAFDRGTRYLRGQCTRMTVSVQAGSEDVAHQAIDIWPPCKLYLYVDLGRSVTATASELLAAGNWVAPDTTGQVMVGLVDEHGREIRTGLIPDSGRAEAEGVLADGSSPPAHAFHYCRGWDIGRDEYELALNRLVEWKRGSDLHEIHYDESGNLTGGAAPTSGNGVTFAAAVFDRAGLRLPQTWGFSRADGAGGIDLGHDPRLEINERYGGDGFRHPWEYGPGANVGLVPLDLALGRFSGPPRPSPGPDASH